MSELCIIPEFKFYNEYGDRQFYNIMFVENTNSLVTLLSNSEEVKQDYVKKEYNIYLDKLKYEMNITSLHPFIRNYEEIIKNPKHYKIEIIQPTTTSIGENEWDQYSTALVKTHWLRLIQRRWRAFLKTRNKEMKNLVNLKHREVTGRFPNHCTTKFQLGIQ